MLVVVMFDVDVVVGVDDVGDGCVNHDVCADIDVAVCVVMIGVCYAIVIVIADGDNVGVGVCDAG